MERIIKDEWNTFKQLFNDSIDELKNDNSTSAKNLSQTVIIFKLTKEDIRRRTEGAISYVNSFCKKFPRYSRKQIFYTLCLLEGATLYWTDSLLKKEYYPLTGCAI